MKKPWVQGLSDTRSGGWDDGSQSALAGWRVSGIQLGWLLPVPPMMHRFASSLATTACNSLRFRPAQDDYPIRTGRHSAKLVACT